MDRPTQWRTEKNRAAPVERNLLVVAHGDAKNTTHMRSVDAPPESETRRVSHANTPAHRGAARKPSSLRHRQEREALVGEARLLADELDVLMRRAGLPTREDLAEVDDINAQNGTLEECLVANDRFLTRLSSMVTNEQLQFPVNPMASFIHLPRDMAERRKILRGMQHTKLRRAVDITTQRLQHLDHMQPYMVTDAFTAESGEYHYCRCEITQPPNFKTARQLHDAFVEFLYNLEINVTEMLGQLTLREDTEDYDPRIWNHRMVTIVEDIGVPEELDLVGFAHFYEHSPITDSPMGIIIYETVNIDDLYPYVPEERTCKDVQAAFLSFEIGDPATSETVVVFKQVHCVVQLPPQFPVADDVEKKLQENIPRWPQAINKYLREYVVPPGE